MDVAPVAVLALNEEGRYIYANRAAEALLGYDSIQITSRHVTDLVEADPEWLRSGLARLQARGFWSGRILYQHGDGGRVKADVNAFVQAFRNGRPVLVALLHPVPLDSPDLAPILDSRLQFGLTAGEIRLLQLMSEGFANKQLADLLGISVSTVSKDVGSVLQKMSASSRTEACVLAIKTHVIL
jgi:PAS domain S-box-containing protein